MASSDDSDPVGHEPSPLKSLEERRRELERRLKAEESTAQTSTLSGEEQRRRGSALGKAFRLSTELVAGVFVGGVIGWLLDYGLHTRPLFLIVFLLLGITAGILNAVREARRMSE